MLTAAQPLHFVIQLGQSSGQALNGLTQRIQAPAYDRPRRHSGERGESVIQFRQGSGWHWIFYINLLI
jgi:hypothetical protein